MVTSNFNLHREVSCPSKKYVKKRTGGQLPHIPDWSPLVSPHGADSCTHKRYAQLRSTICLASPHRSRLASPERLLK